MPRIRLDKLLVTRKMANNLDQAKLLIESGCVLVNGAIQKSPSSAIETSSALTFVPEKSKYVSRAGFKLEAAIEAFEINVDSKRCLDIGTSTGGFTDCFLQYGAKEVVSVDVGHGQIDDVLRKNSKVVLLEKTNAKSITPDLIGGMCQLGALDVSFTSAIPLLNAVVACLDPIELIILIKPQFEVKPKYVNNKGIVESSHVHKECIEEFMAKIPSGLILTKLIPSPIVGTHGNLEFLCLLENKETISSRLDQSILEEGISKAVEEAHRLRKVL